MGKKVSDTGAYWHDKEEELVDHAAWLVFILDEFIEASAEDCEDLWFLYDSRAAAQRIVDAYEPPDEPEGGHKDNVISFTRSKALKR